MYNDIMISYLLHGIVLKSLFLGNSNDCYIFDSTFCNALTKNGEIIKEGTNLIDFDCYIDTTLKKRGLYNGSSCMINKDFIFMFVNIDNAHWVLYLIYKPYEATNRNPIVFIFDSIFNGKSSYIIYHSKLILLLKRFFEKHHAIHTGSIGVFNQERGYLMVKVPVQQDGFSCGPRAISFLKYFLFNLIDSDQRHLYIKEIFADAHVMYDERSLRCVNK
jgi:hypothetical protein